MSDVRAIELLERAYADMKLCDETQTHSDFHAERADIAAYLREGACRACDGFAHFPARYMQCAKRAACERLGIVGG